jgi:hypothetical protein
MQTRKAKVLMRVSLGIVLLATAFMTVAVAQSTDVAWPSPIRTNEVSATIPARDIGDPRVTDHFYAFTGTPGDVLITVDSRNLNGDVDVFTLTGLRPLLKFSVYAGSSAPITKSIYLRQREDLVLRVEGRTPDDDDAVYRIHLGGAFESIISGPLAEHEDALQPANSAEASITSGRRVSSVGARIEEPRVEVAKVPEPEPAAVTPPESKPKTAAAKPGPARRNTRPGRPAPRRTRPTAVPKRDETASRDESEKKAGEENPETAPPSVVKRPVARNRTPRRSKTSTATLPATLPTAQPPEETGPRLVIETSDGTLVDRAMGGVRRVTVENGMVVVVGKDGKIQRIPLATVLRMTIAP